MARLNPDLDAKRAHEKKKLEEKAAEARTAEKIRKRLRV
jgi:hypothetical protein